MMVLIAVSLIVFLVAVVFSIDVGYMFLTRTQLRASTDAAARAAGEALSRVQNMAQARQAAKDLAAANPVAGAPLLLDDSDIVFGNSQSGAGGAWTFTAGGLPTNSIRVNGRRTTSSPSGNVPLLFGRLMGVNYFEPTQTATTVRLDRDIVLVVDRSSSMKLGLDSLAEFMSTSDPRFPLPPPSPDSRWAALSAAVDTFIDTLATTPQAEQVGLVSYGSEGTWCGIYNTASDIDQPLATDTALIHDGIQRISNRVFNGATAISAGIDNGVVVLTDPARARPYAGKTMVLLTDGSANSGRPTLDAARDAVARDIVIHTITFGAGANQAAMEQVAALGGGKHYHAPDAQTLRDIFREIALTLPVMFTQ
jgi:Flp pilus assembly protein TadG